MNPKDPDKPLTHKTSPIPKINHFAARPPFNFIGTLYDFYS